MNHLSPLRFELHHNLPTIGWVGCQDYESPVAQPIDYAPSRSRIKGGSSADLSQGGLAQNVDSAKRRELDGGELGVGAGLLEYGRMALVGFAEQMADLMGKIKQS